MARVEIGGVERTISLMLTPEAQVGDYALVHTGFAIGVLDEEEAHETLRLLQELAALQEGEGKEGKEGKVGQAYEVY